MGAVSAGLGLPSHADDSRWRTGDDMLLVWTTYMGFRGGWTLGGVAVADSV